MRKQLKWSYLLVLVYILLFLHALLGLSADLPGLLIHPLCLLAKYLLLDLVPLGLGLLVVGIELK